MELARSIFVLLFGWYGFSRFVMFYVRAFKAGPEGIQKPNGQFR